MDWSWMVKFQYYISGIIGESNICDLLKWCYWQDFELANFSSYCLEESHTYQTTKLKSLCYMIGYRGVQYIWWHWLYYLNVLLFTKLIRVLTNLSSSINFDKYTVIHWSKVRVFIVAQLVQYLVATAYSYVVPYIWVVAIA